MADFCGSCAQAMFGTEWVAARLYGDFTAEVLALEPGRCRWDLCEGSAERGGHWHIAGRNPDGTIVIASLPFWDEKRRAIEYSWHSFVAALLAKGWREIGG